MALHGKEAKALGHSAGTSDNGQKSKEELILEAAEREFLQKGYAGARTVAIAEAAGVTHAMLHYYFRSKEKLFEQIMSRKITMLRDLMMESVGNQGMPLFEKIRLTIENHMKFLAANPDLPRFLVNEVFGQPERMGMVRKMIEFHAPRVVESLQRQIDEYASRRECRGVDARMLILDFVSLNVFSFVAMPLVNVLMGDLPIGSERFLRERTRENIDTIMRKLKP
ncbi:MAG: TetR/AcrR family transcriptional regulator [[Clostridium] fimetarium]|nr:TetR/AcrR family transcriptional regulator [Alistipes timonensis]MCM1404831.1 TetR/AcrR family transcriptional regulator [[Clostridium] fimetarium]